MTPTGPSTAFPALRLVNGGVVVRRQVLRLVTIDHDRADAHTPRPEQTIAPDALPARSEARLAARLCAGRVGADPLAGLGVSRGARPLSTAGEVRREMMSAAALPAEDARLILARRTAEQLEGGRLARLSPMRRRGLERLSTRLGLREFDASLVIAIAQDAARNGERVESNAVGGRLQMVREPTSPARGGAWAWRLASATALAAVMLLGLVRWVGGA